MNYRTFITSQSILMTASSMVFPFYLLLIRNIGDSYSQFGLAYGLFALTAAMVHPLIGRLSDRIGDRPLLLLYTWGMVGIMLIVPIIETISALYILQILMGVLGAVQKTTEKTTLARKTAGMQTGRRIGNYHLWTSVWGAVAVMATGYLIDFLTIGSLFYIASFLYMISAVVLMKSGTLLKQVEDEPVQA
ncbi:MFS transporter [Fictibacillus nanhaiensis]|jgi:MFS family permease|uniref:MFS transporter n=1 Tax=Fictibacillus nanhaiensis TaxID=742169 RepID=UPI00204101C7|nr:MFS transporter [Fictibacillus nanhaiensis]MCM3733312.1 MFS transporter [Fictibacillus nanhaiensis]